MKILVTGAAGFIGSALILRLLDRGDMVIGVDNHNNYYDPAIKEARLARYLEHPNYTHLRIDLSDCVAMEDCFATYKPNRVVNLAAKAGVRYSIENPLAYVESNIVGFTHILEGCRHHGVEHLVYANSSSVYGANTNMPFSVHNVDHPLSFYAASKKANEQWHIHTATCTSCQQQGCASLLFAALGEGLIWHCSSLQINPLLVSR